MDQKDEIKGRVDVVELVSEYVQLKSAGGSSMKGLCPFHQEKSPSFTVSRDKQFYYCFGCQEGGDVFAFYMKMEGVDFSEALRALGKKVGIEVTRFSTTEANEKQRWFSLVRLAEAFYQKVLEDSSSAEYARAYVATRGMTPDLLEQFRIGYAPAGWDSFYQIMKKRGFTDQEGEQMGLLLRKRQGVGMIDRFRDRIMIPLRDVQGNTVGFTGRVFAPSVTSLSLKPGEKDERPKYMNSPETPLYHKGEILFGLDMARQAIRKEKKVVIVEGNLDVIASHKAGVPYVVGSSGTALTMTQLLLLKRFTETLIFSFDADAAGFEAARRGIHLATELGFTIQVARLPESAGKDPDEAVQKNPLVWRETVAHPIPAMQFFIDRGLKGKDLSSLNDKKAFAALILPELQRITNIVEREHWMQALADLLRMDVALVRKQLAALPPVQPMAKEPLQSAVVASPVSPAPVPEPLTKDEQHALFLLCLAVQKKEQVKEVCEQLNPDLLSNVSLKALYDWVKSEYPVYLKDTVDFSSFFRDFYEQAQRVMPTASPWVTKIAFDVEQTLNTSSPQEITTIIHTLIQNLLSARATRRRAELARLLREAERVHDTQAVQDLLKKYKDAS